MKLFFLLFFTTVSFDVYAQQDKAGTSLNELRQLYQEKRLYVLEKALEGYTAGPQYRAVKNLFTAALQNAWMRVEASEESLQRISQQQLALIDDTLQLMYYRLRSDNSIKLFDYKGAASTGAFMVDHYARFFTEKELQELKESNDIWKLTAAEQPQQVSHKALTALPVKRDRAGLMNVPVGRGDSTYDFVFDTGAGISTIMESFAKKLGLRILPGATVPVRSGITGIATQSQLAVADEMRIGNIEVRHALFLVFPDSALTFGKGVYSIRGIIGFPVIKELGDMTFKNDSLFIPQQEPDFAPLRNLAVEELKPFIFLRFDNDTLPFTFDTGAQETIFSDVFYHAYQPWIDQHGKPAQTILGGTNGSRVFKGFSLPPLSLFCNGREAVMKNKFVSTEPLPTTDKYFYGNVGKDFIRSFTAMTLNFKKGYARFD